MKGLFSSHRGTSLLLGLFSFIVIIQRINGYPFPWRRFFTYEEDRTATRESSDYIGDGLSAEDGFGDDAEIPAENKVIHYLEPSAAMPGDTGLPMSRIVESSQQNRAIEFGDEDPEDERYHDEAVVAEDASKSDIKLNIKPDNDKYSHNATENTDDEITRVINEAIEDEIFLTEEELELKKANKNGAVQRKLEPNDDGMVFPGQGPITNMDEFSRLPVPSCEGTTFCENVPYYPSDEFVENAMRINYIAPINTPSTISQRMGPLDNDRDDGLCFSETKTIQPQSGKDENNQWHYILNNKKYVQTVKIEYCRNAGHPCRVYEDPAMGWKTLCKQKNVYQQLVAIVPNGTVALKAIEVPSSCCCHFIFDADDQPGPEKSAPSTVR